MQRDDVLKHRYMRALRFGTENDQKWLPASQKTASINKGSSWTTTALIKKVEYSLKAGNPQENEEIQTYLHVGEQGCAEGIGSLELLHDHPGADDNS